MAEYTKLEFADGYRKFLAGLSWDINEGVVKSLREKPYDLDLSCRLFSKDKVLIDSITPTDPKRHQYGEQILHSGDNQSGSAEFEDESIQVNLDKISADIAYIVFTVSGKGGTLVSSALNPASTFMDGVTLKIFKSIDLSLGKSTEDAGTQYVTGVLKRLENGDWGFDTPSLSVNSEDELNSRIRDVL